MSSTFHRPVVAMRSDLDIMRVPMLDDHKAGKGASYIRSHNKYKTSYIRSQKQAQDFIHRIGY